MGLQVGRQVGDERPCSSAVTDRSPGGMAADSEIGDTVGGPPRGVGRCPRAVIAQRLHHRLDGDAPLLGLQKLRCPALASCAGAEAGVEEIGEAAGEVEVLARLAPSALNGILNQPWGGHVPLVADGQSIRDGPDVAHSLGYPELGYRLQHPGLGGVGDDEGVVVMLL